MGPRSHLRGAEVSSLPPAVPWHCVADDLMLVPFWTAHPRRVRKPLSDLRSAMPSSSKHAEHRLICRSHWWPLKFSWKSMKTYNSFSHLQHLTALRLVSCFLQLPVLSRPLHDFCWKGCQTGHERTKCQQVWCFSCYLLMRRAGGLFVNIFPVISTLAFSSQWLLAKSIFLIAK